MADARGWRTLVGLSVAATALMAMTPATGFAGGRGHHHGHDDDGCMSVHGPFTSVAVPPPACTSVVGFCTSGQLGGTLNGGTYAFTMNTMSTVPEPAAQFVSFFTGNSAVTTRSGRVIRGIDTGAMNLMPPGEEGSGQFSTLLSFIDGGSGYLHIRGALDLATGNVEGDFEGEICPD
jgi:hypothetical protein